MKTIQSKIGNGLFTFCGVDFSSFEKKRSVKRLFDLVFAINFMVSARVTHLYKFNAKGNFLR